MLDNLPEPSPIFQIIHNHGVAKDEMYKTFNMGVGFCIIAPREEEARISQIFKKHGFYNRQIGKIVEKKGVFIDKLRIA